MVKRIESEQEGLKEKEKEKEKKRVMTCIREFFFFLCFVLSNYFQFIKYISNRDVLEISSFFVFCFWHERSRKRTKGKMRRRKKKRSEKEESESKRKWEENIQRKGQWKEEGNWERETKYWKTQESYLCKVLFRRLFLFIQQKISFSTHSHSRLLW